MWGEVGVLQKMIDDAKSEGYISFPLSIINFTKTCLHFTMKIMIFIKNTIFIFIAVTCSYKNFKISKKAIYWVCF